MAHTSRTTRRQQNVHRTSEREPLYPWHPWFGRRVHVHELAERAGREIFRCNLSGEATDRRLEVPAWMFDRAAHATWRNDAVPQVDFGSLAALAALLPAIVPAMVILDDALAYSDGERMERMFDILSHAGRRMQILILSCRDSLFEKLGATRLTIGNMTASISAEKE